VSSNTSFAPSNNATTSKTKGILSLVFGILSLVLSLLIPIVGVLSGIAAVILGFLSRKNEPGARGLSLAGIITGFAGIVANLAFWIITAVVVAQVIQQ
jgi:hypothetical protein